MYETDETGFFDIVDTLEGIENGESSAKRIPNVTRQTLSNIDQTEKRRQWYIEADDERVQDALEQVAE